MRRSRSAGASWAKARVSSNGMERRMKEGAMNFNMRLSACECTLDAWPEVHSTALSTSRSWVARLEAGNLSLSERLLVRSPLPDILALTAHYCWTTTNG